MVMGGLVLKGRVGAWGLGAGRPLAEGKKGYSVLCEGQGVCEGGMGGSSRRSCCDHNPRTDPAHMTTAPPPHPIT